MAQAIDGMRVAPLKRFARVGNGGTPTADEINWGGDIPFVTPPDLNGLDGKAITTVGRSLTEVGARSSGVAQPGDVIVSTRAPIGHIGTAVADCAFNQGCRSVRAGPALSSAFLAYVLVSARPEMESRGLGTTFVELSGSGLASLPVMVPPLGIQLRTVEYLDKETAEIDAFIADQEQLIGLLAERHASKTARVLSIGMDESASVRASGLDHIGVVPEHWSIVPTRRLCTITTGVEDSGNANPAGEYPFFVRGREILRSDSYLFDTEAVMTPGDGQGGTGKVFHYYFGKFQAHQRVYVFKDFSGIAARYFYYYISAFLQPVALSRSNTVTMESLRRPMLADFMVALPPLDEQNRAVDYLDAQTASIDALIADADRSVALASERRAALITAAVTGQIDVTSGRPRIVRPTCEAGSVPTSEGEL